MYLKKKIPMSKQASQNIFLEDKILFLFYFLIDPYTKKFELFNFE